MLVQTQTGRASHVAPPVVCSSGFLQPSDLDSHCQEAVLFCMTRSWSHKRCPWCSMVAARQRASDATPSKCSRLSLGITLCKQQPGSMTGLCGRLVDDGLRATGEVFPSSMDGLSSSS